MQTPVKSHWLSTAPGNGPVVEMHRFATELSASTK